MADIDRLWFSVPLPPRDLHPNARVHFLRRNEVFQHYADSVKGVVALLVGERTPRFARAGMEIIFVYPDRRRRDLDGALASCKALFDGMVAGGAVPDDCWACIPVIVVGHRIERHGDPHLEVTLTAAMEATR